MTACKISLLSRGLVFPTPMIAGDNPGACVMYNEGKIEVVSNCHTLKHLHALLTIVITTIEEEQEEQRLKSASNAPAPPTETLPDNDNE